MKIIQCEIKKFKNIIENFGKIKSEYLKDKNEEIKILKQEIRRLSNIIKNLNKSKGQ